MFETFFYKDKQGNEPVLKYIQKLASRKDKDSRIRLNKIYDYLDFLEQVGKAAGEPYVKHLDGEIWELRPLKDRILFAAWDGAKIILLHHFIKKTMKTPPREIKQAKRNLADYRERGNNNG
ncbi:MAG: type II toxin-antitoxin system RelE/ParE family toxin [Oscillospiraceae bacterium]|nr:type II toxin-antitoxin system RelE/ParE family toxin [Oscillospiraceae bacterium]